MYNVLIVEDDEHLLRMYKRVFQLNGYTANGVSDGREALLLSQARKHHLILLDVMLPSYDGFSLLTSMRQNPLTKDCVIVMLTNLNDHEKQEESYQQGADLYLIKNDHEPMHVFHLANTLVEKSLSKKLA